MVWTGSAQYRLAPALLTLLRQLEQAYPGQQWLTSPQTGTIGDTRHMAEGDKSDHVPWLDNTVRALDVAVNVSGVAGIQTVTDGPPGAALFAAVNAMYGARDPRVFPDGYVIFNRRITDPANPGGSKPYYGTDPHIYHVHTSVSTNPAGFNSAEPWILPFTEAPAPASGPATKLTPAALSGGRVFRIIRNVKSGAIRACAPNFWASLEGGTTQETLAIVEFFRRDPLCVGNVVEDVSNGAMQLIYNVYMKGRTAG